LVKEPGPEPGQGLALLTLVTGLLIHPYKCGLARLQRCVELQPSPGATPSCLKINISIVILYIQLTRDKNIPPAQ